MIQFEKSFSPEIPTRDEVVQLFKQQGESFQAVEAYKLWFIQMQKEADESKSTYSRLEFNIEVADLLVDSNLVFDVGEYLFAAYYMIQMEMVKVPEGDIPEKLVRLNEKLKSVEEKLGRG